MIQMAVVLCLLLSTSIFYLSIFLPAMTFSTQHLSTVLKYGGISFIAGAVNHGFFSESRSLWTALLGVVFT